MIEIDTHDTCAQRERASQVRVGASPLTVWGFALLQVKCLTLSVLWPWNKWQQTWCLVYCHTVSVGQKSGMAGIEVRMLGWSSGSSCKFISVIGRM